mmetsp:Transcript_86819/g.223572  ORF Transcript_86819/g.223572 Transcript_86819/m.223572 type:complete len:249 (-) Transcript_86819:171-917(-)
MAAMKSAARPLPRHTTTGQWFLIALSIALNETGPPFTRIMTRRTSAIGRSVSSGSRAPYLPLATYCSSLSRRSTSEPKASLPFLPESARMQCVWCCWSPASCASSPSRSSFDSAGASATKSSDLDSSSTPRQAFLSAPNGVTPMQGTVLRASCWCMACPTRSMTPESVPPVMTQPPVCFAAPTRPLQKCSLTAAVIFMPPAPPMTERMSFGASRSNRLGCLMTMSHSLSALACLLRMQKRVIRPVLGN